MADQQILQFNSMFVCINFLSVIASNPNYVFNTYCDNCYFSALNIGNTLILISSFLVHLEIHALSRSMLFIPSHNKVVEGI